MCVVCINTWTNPSPFRRHVRAKTIMFGVESLLFSFSFFPFFSIEIRAWHLNFEGSLFSWWYLSTNPYFFLYVNLVFSSLVNFLFVFNFIIQSNFFFKFGSGSFFVLHIFSYPFYKLSIAFNFIIWSRISICFKKKKN
jgi:hypothetical protein